MGTDDEERENIAASKDQEDGGAVMAKAQRSRRFQMFRHYYQHPYFRIFVAYFVTLCNFLIYAEDPVAHSYSKCEIPIIGNAFSFVVTKYPASGFSALKVLLWIIAIIVGILVGKLVIHHLLFKRLFKLSMFSNDQGSWIICFLVTILSLVIFSFIYNGFLSLHSTMSPYKVTGYIGAKNHVFMRGAAIGTWFGDFITAWMVTDMMLQDSTKYPDWSTRFRMWWKEGLRRVILFWAFFVVLTIIVICIISTDFINWDTFNRDMFYTNELGRSFLASFILVMDFSIVMQDWDFPLFQTNMDVKLPGLNTAHISFQIPACLRREYWMIHVTGKWFNYGVLLIVMLLDLNMWKNQIFYKPLDFGQYTGPDGRIYSVQDTFSLYKFKNQTIYSYGWRSNHTNPLTNLTYLAGDTRINSRYRNYSLGLRGIAFIPSIFAFIMFGVLIYIFGREGTSQFEDAQFKKRGVSLTGFQAKRSTRRDVSEEDVVDSKVISTADVEEKPVSTTTGNTENYGTIYDEE